MKSWSSTQKTIAMSSAEAELYAMIKASAEAVGFQPLMMDLGVEAEIVLHVDSSAAIGMSNRSGIGKQSMCRSSTYGCKKH